MTNKQTAVKVIKKLRTEGFQALLAGGCVRDMLLGRAANDYDVATDARPDEVIKLFRRTLKVGAKFGVVIVLLENEQVEVATFRTETGYTDGRHPENVEFTNAKADAARRDFTINAMFYDPIEKQIIDYCDGQADLKKKIIRTVGQPNERFGEDYLRMLRAVRFSTQLEFKIETKTWTAIKKGAKNIQKISGERRRMELEIMLVHPNRQAGLSLLIESGLAEALFEGFVGEKLKQAENVVACLNRKTDFALALAALFVDCETKFALEKCKTLKLSRNQTKHIKFLIINRGKLLEEKMSLAELKLIASEPYFEDLYELQKAIQKSSGKPITVLGKLKKRVKALGNIEFRPNPLLNGYELIQLGSVKGPGLGQLSQELYIAQLEGTVQNKEQAEKWARKWLQRHTIG